MIKFRSQNAPKRGSLGVAMIFIAIAVIGVMLTISSPSKKQKSSEIEKPSLETVQPLETVQHNQIKKSNYSSYLLRVILITAAIIAVILVGSRLYRKQMRLGDSNKVNISILGRQYISPKHSLIMVRVTGRRFLLGITDSSVNLISEFEDEIESEIGIDNELEKTGIRESMTAKGNNSTFDTIVEKLKTTSLS
ncbi:MAG: flagellar biosynthetic protein FliO [Candidatus Hatepunaea meridiana]|nr:flagellar biosynthetic protein FliO [Candidatus Hatepunaea meridiana]